MDLHERINNEIDILNEALAEDPADHLLYIERGKLYYRNNNFGSALNDFLNAQRIEPGSVEAQEYISMIREILDFRYTDIYNP